MKRARTRPTSSGRCCSPTSLSRLLPASSAMRSMLYWDTFPKGTIADERDVSRTSLGPLMEAIAAIRSRTKQLIMNVMPMRFSIQDIMTRIASLFSSKNKIALHEAAPTGEKTEIIGAFMAALEMSKLSIVRLIQKGLFSTIYLVKRQERD